MNEVLSQEWRVEHCTKGDEALDLARHVIEQASEAPGAQAHVCSVQAAALAAIAQAHYAAANVRARSA